MKLQNGDSTRSPEKEGLNNDNEGQAIQKMMNNNEIQFRNESNQATNR